MRRDDEKVVKVVSGVSGLESMRFAEAKQIALKKSSRKYQELSDLTQIKLSTIKRCFTDENYHPSAQNIPDLCLAMQNFIMVEWMAANVGCYLVRVETADNIGSLSSFSSDIFHEAANIMEEYGNMVSDGIITEGELEIFEDMLHDLLVATQRTLELTQKTRHQLRFGK